MSPLKPPYTLIREGLSQGRVIPFLGAGASLGTRDSHAEWDTAQPAHLPTATELASRLARKTDFPPNESQDLAKVAQYYDIVGGHEELRRELHSIFAHNYRLTSLHRFLAQVSASTPLLIVTTNFDDLIEHAFDEFKCPYDLVIYTTDPNIGERTFWRQHGAAEPEEVSPNKLDIDLKKVSVIYKMHGAVDRTHPERDQYVITEDDYVDFLVRMTKNKAIPSIFAEPFQKRHFMFLAYSLRDWNLRVVLNRIEKDLGRGKSVPSWAIQINPSPLEQLFWEKRGVEVYDMTVEEFIKELAAR